MSNISVTDFYKDPRKATFEGFKPNLINTVKMLWFKTTLFNSFPRTIFYFLGLLSSLLVYVVLLINYKSGKICRAKNIEDIEKQINRVVTLQTFKKNFKKTDEATDEK